MSNDAFQITEAVLRAYDELKKLHPPSERDRYWMTVDFLKGATGCSVNEVRQALSRQGIEEPTP